MDWTLYSGSILDRYSRPTNPANPVSVLYGKRWGPTGLFDPSKPVQDAFAWMDRHGRSNARCDAVTEFGHNRVRKSANSTYQLYRDSIVTLEDLAALVLTGEVNLNDRNCYECNPKHSRHTRSGYFACLMPYYLDADHHLRYGSLHEIGRRQYKGGLILVPGYGKKIGKFGQCVEIETDMENFGSSYSRFYSAYSKLKGDIWIEFLNQGKLPNLVKNLLRCFILKDYSTSFPIGFGENDEFENLDLYVSIGVRLSPDREQLRH